MSTTILKRPPRRPLPELPAGDVILESPPELPQPSTKGWTQLMMLLPMAAGSGAMALMFAAPGTSAGPLQYITGGMFGLSMLGMIATSVLTQSGQPSKQELLLQRRDYMRQLAATRKKVRKTIEQQRTALFTRHPDPTSLWSTAQSQRLWERRSGDDDFGMIRIGVGPQELATALIPPQTRPVEDLEPICAAALRRFVNTYGVVPDLPIAVALRGFSRIYLRGDLARTRALTRAMMAGLTAFHAPDNMLVTICVSNDRRGAWEWAKWLPHALHPAKTDALGPIRLVAPTVTGLEAMLEDVLGNRPRFDPTTPPIDGPHIVVVLDDGETAGSDHLMTEGGVDGLTILDLSTPPPRLLGPGTLVMEIDHTGRLLLTSADERLNIGRPDELGIIEAEGLARQLSPLRLSAGAAGESALSASLDLTELLQIGDPYEFEPTTTWVARPNRDKLRVPIGLGPDGSQIELDIKESAQDGMGPHGLLIGATGSGKSELLRTLVLALAITHNSEALNFVLSDFKGGATFTKLDKLPHTSAVITNLADELPLVDRMTDAINGELVRRQELLRKAGNYASQRDYEKARAAGAPLAPLPSLLIVCDEFSELLTAKPDFIDMFVQIGRVGRSLGVHLLLASQRLEEGRLRGLDTHLSYRVGLRTFSAMESRTVLGVPDAYELPRSPGHGYLKFGTEPLIRFKAAYVSGAYRRTLAGASRGGGRRGAPVLDYSSQYVAPKVEEKPEVVDTIPDENEDALAESLLDILIGRMEGRGVPAHQVWLPPLKEPPTLDQLYPPLGTDNRRGLTVVNPDLQGALHSAVGIVDKPFEQRRDLLWLDLSGGNGHLAVIGGPQSGKSTVLRTMVTSMALCHTPAEVQFYCLDFGGGGLTSLRDLAHVGGVSSRLDTDQVRRTVSEIVTLLEERERRFAEHGIDSMATYRRAKREGRFADDPFGDVFLVVDGWLTLRNEFEDMESAIVDIAGRGLSFGVHVAVSSARWLDLRTAIRDLLGTRLELRLGDPVDSYVNRKAASNVPADTPGRGLTPEGLHFLSALPRIDGRQETDDLVDGVAKLIAGVNGAWAGSPAPRVRLLPDELPYSALPAPGTEPRPGLIPIGIAESNLGPVFLDTVNEPHFMLLGDVECGKSAFLRAFARSITDRYTPAQAKIIAIDYRRSLLGAISPDHLIGYGTSADLSSQLLADAATVMRDRLPGPDVTPDQLRNRTWWKGPELFVLVDDYDMVAGGMNNPVGHLLDFLAQGRDVGLHLVLTRRMGGASRGMYESVLQRLRELAMPGMMMSGNRDEGPLLGNIKPQLLPPGRGWLVTRRGGNQLIQLAWFPPEN